MPFGRIRTFCKYLRSAKYLQLYPSLRGHMHKTTDEYDDDDDDEEEAEGDRNYAHEVKAKKALKMLENSRKLKNLGNYKI